MGRNKDEQQESQNSEEQQPTQQKAEIRRPKIQRLDKFKTLKKVVINISMTQYPVVSQVAQSLDWKIQYSNQAGDWDVYWTDFAIDPDILIKMHLFQKINHYPGIHVIARKNLLGLNLMGLRAKFPEEYNFFPLTWMLPLQYAEFRAYYESKPKGKARTYIAKPQAECQGRGIFLTRKIEDLQNGKHYVIQRYLARPYLLQGLKFDLRIYVLLCGTNPLRLYMYEQGLARLATQQYIQPTTSNLQKQYIHLTNYAINKNNPKFVFNNSSKNMGVGHKRSITCVFKQLQSNGVDIPLLKERINDVAIKTIICGLPLMSHQYKCSQPEDYSGGMCFHILGLDIMLNNLAEPILLQVNHTPSFTTDTPLDHKIKFNLIRDTLRLMNINVQRKNELFNRAKDLNMERLVTGKRQIFEGKEREDMIASAQRERDQYEDKHLGGFQRIFPLKDQQKMEKYNQIIETANQVYFQENGSLRRKMMEKQAKKLVKADQKKTIPQLQEKQKIKPVSSLKRQIIKIPSSIHKIISNVPRSQNKSFYYDKPTSIGKNQHLTRSQHRIDGQNELQASAQLVQETPEPRHNPNSIIKIKKYSPHVQPQRSSIKQPKFHRQQLKSTSQPSDKPLNFPTTQSIFSQKQPIFNQIVIKKLTRLQNTGPANHDFFPNIAQAYMINNDVHSIFRKEQRISSLTKNQEIMKASTRGKLYQQISKDMKDLIDKKTHLIMPKLTNPNHQADKRSSASPSTGLLALGKATIFLQNQ